MRGSVSSSKRKSSKKRNHKTSSSSKKKKSKRKELKKRRYDSVSSFSRDDSVKSDCSSSSISDYRRKVKKSKRRHRRDYSISSCSDDDHSRSTGSESLPRRNDKKLRRTKTDSKSSNKMARKRYSSPESDGDARRVRKTKRKRSTRDRDGKRKKKSSTKKSKRDLSPDSLSCSTCPSKSSSSTVDGKSERSKQINMETELTSDKDREVSSPYMPPPVNNSSRLRSVINVAHQPDEDDRWGGNLHDEDIVHELDNYPSPIILYSNEVGGKKELDDHSHHGISNKRIKLEHVTAEEGTKLGKNEGHVDPHTNNFEEKETNVSGPTAAALGGDKNNNMESILRQKAIENMRKFKAGRLQTAPQCIANVKTNNENDVPNQSTKQATTPQTQLTNLKSGLTFEKYSSRSEVKKHPKPEDVVVVEEPVAVEQKNTISVTTSENNNQGTPVAQSSILEPTSSARPVSGHHTLEEDRDEVNDGPEFEQKTMSVMRGGEMVQVTYKVKIPKRAPALARRQLRR